MSKENVKSGQQGTDNPWERPGQMSQDPSIEAPDRDDREGRYKAPPAEAPRPAKAPPDKKREPIPAERGPADKR